MPACTNFSHVLTDNSPHFTMRIVAGVVELKLCHYRVRAWGGVTGHGGMFHAQLEQSFYLVYGSVGVRRVVRA